MNKSAQDTTATLRRSLAQEDVYMSHSTREWLKRTPHEEALNILAEIAADAQPERRSIVQHCVTMLLASFATSDGLNPKAVARRVGTRAAIMLADMDDPRALPPLVRVFELNMMRQGNYQELVEKSLTRYLTQVVKQIEAKEEAKEESKEEAKEAKAKEAKAEVGAVGSGEELRLNELQPYEEDLRILVAHIWREGRSELSPS